MLLGDHMEFWGLNSVLQHARKVPYMPYYLSITHNISILEIKKFNQKSIPKENLLKIPLAL